MLIRELPVVLPSRNVRANSEEIIPPSHPLLSASSPRDFRRRSYFMIQLPTRCAENYPLASVASAAPYCREPSLMSPLQFRHPTPSLYSWHAVIFLNHHLR